MSRSVTFFVFHYEERKPVRLFKEKIIGCPWNQQKMLDGGRRMYDPNDVEVIRFSTSGEYETSSPREIGFLKIYNTGGYLNLENGKVVSEEDPALDDLLNSGTVIRIKPNIDGVWIADKLPTDITTKIVIEKEVVNKMFIPKKLAATLSLKDLREFARDADSSIDANVDRDALFERLESEGYIK